MIPHTHTHTHTHGWPRSWTITPSARDTIRLTVISLQDSSRGNPHEPSMTPFQTTRPISRVAVLDLCLEVPGVLLLGVLGVGGRHGASLHLGILVRLVLALREVERLRELHCHTANAISACTKTNARRIQMEHAAALSAAHIAARQHGPAIVALCVPPKWSRPPRCNNKCCPSSDPGLMPIPQAMAFLPAPRSATLPCATARGGSEAQRPSQMRSTPSTNHIPRGTRKRTDLGHTRHGSWREGLRGGNAGERDDRCSLHFTTP